VALVAALCLLALPGTCIAASASVGSAPIIQAGDEPLAQGAGYGSADDAKRVRSLQRTLRRLGWSPGPVDGLFGPRTEAAVVRFQRSAGVAADGIVGPRTSRELRQAEPRPLRVGAGYERPEGSPRVRAMQGRLRELGLRPGPVDGRFGPRTQAALMRLQAAAGAPLRGVLDDATGRLLANADAILRDDRQPSDRRDRKPDTGGRQETPQTGGQQGTPDTGRQQETPDTGGQNAPASADDRGRESPRADAQDNATRTPAAGGDESTGLSIPLLLLAAGLAALAGALLTRVASAAPDTSVPLAKGIVAEGRARDASIGGFRGEVRALVLGTRGLLRRPQARYLVSDPDKPGSFWVTHDEIDKLVTPTSSPVPSATNGTEARTGNRHGNGNGASANGTTAVGYATVPKGDQRNGALVREQAAAISALCENRGWKLLELVRDVEEPRVKGLDRPGLTYALERVAKGEASCLVVSQLRRLSRSAADLGRILESIAAGGGRLVAMDVDVDTAVPAGRKAANVLISVGAWERERLGERTRKGLEAARAKGSRIGRPAIDDLPELKDRIAAMRANGMTLQAIADRLNEEGVPTLRGGEKWRPSSVQAAVGYRRPQRRWENGNGGSSRGGRAKS
jgi:DNA invertase Pin-like site-specific DNA recombinase/peptidoglycan hydrolase-like protein with peptidoglycan-binding domain